MTDPLARIVDQIDDHMSDSPRPRLSESLAETTTALALLDIAASLRTIAAALDKPEAAADEFGDRWERPAQSTASYDHLPEDIRVAMTNQRKGTPDAVSTETDNRERTDRP